MHSMVLFAALSYVRMYVWIYVFCMSACVCVFGVILSVLEYADEKTGWKHPEEQLTLGNGFGKAVWGKEISLPLYTSVFFE